MTQANYSKKEHASLRIVAVTLICCLVGMFIGFVFTNTSSLINILKQNPQKTYQINQVELLRWTAMDAENQFCSEEDPIIIFPNHNGYIASIEVNMEALEGTPECDPRIYWTDMEHPVFSEDCSQVLLTKKTDNGYILSVNRYVKDFRLDLYNDAGAKIWIDSFNINPRTLEFPGELLFPIVIISIMLSIYMHQDIQQNISGSSESEKVHELDIIRAICAIGVIVFHVSVSKYLSHDAPGFFQRYANGNFGSLIVGVFFMISGGVLYHNYKDTGNLLVFYYKRWKSIFPMSYVTYLFFFVQDAVAANALFYRGKPQRILLSVFGLDGYLRYRYPGYYIVGEWFLGAIVLLYVLYPIFAKLVNAMGWKILFFIIPLVSWQIHTNWFEISETRNLIYCSTQFILGMLIFKYRIYKNKILKLAACCISIVVFLIPIPNFGLLKSAISYVFIFLALFSVAELVIKMPLLKNIFAFIGSLSFPMFLIQNKVIYFLTTNITVKTYPALFKLMLLAVCLSVIYAWCIKTVAQGVMRTKWFSRVDKAILSLRNKGI